MNVVIDNEYSVSFLESKLYENLAELDEKHKSCRMFTSYRVRYIKGKLITIDEENYESLFIDILNSIEKEERFSYD